MRGIAPPLLSSVVVGKLAPVTFSPRFLIALALTLAACKPKPAAPAIPPSAPSELTTPDAPEIGEPEPGPADAVGDEGDFSSAPAQSGGSAPTIKPPPAGSEAPAKPVTKPSPGKVTAAWMRDAAAKITAHVSGKRRAWDRLATMVDRFGHRLSGSKALEQSIDWALETMAADGLENVHREPVTVPHWVRGRESLAVVSPTARELKLLGLGGTVGTKGKLVAPVVIVNDLDDLERRSAELPGKIVLVNQRMPAYDHDKAESGYGTAVRPRGEGASRAAKHGAKGLLIRSVTAVSLDTPHTGSLRYSDDAPKIPAAAITHEGAELLARLAARGEVKVQLSLGARTLPDARSGNAIAELRGRERPEEVVLIGGHIDSWDVGDGAADDGAGCLMAMEAALLLKELGLVPRRTIRVVLFTNEENGLAGAQAYFKAHGREVHVAAIESDSGAGAPKGFSVASKDPATVASVERLAPLFGKLGADDISAGWGGADISPLIDAGVLGIAVRPESSRYFDVHHSPADTIEKIDPDHLERNAGALALLAYLLAERE